jgi:hypothetical protein
VKTSNLMLFSLYWLAIFYPKRRELIHYITHSSTVAIYGYYDLIGITFKHNREKHCTSKYLEIRN